MPLDNCHDGPEDRRMPTTSGIDLKVERVREGVTVTALAVQMGLSRQSVHGIERAGKVTPERATQYRAALADIANVTQTLRPETAA